MSGDAVGARLERDHVDALGRAVRHRRSLAGLEVQTVEVPRDLDELVHIEANHARERARRAGETLEPDVDARAALSLPLLDNVREHAVAGRKVQPPHDLLEELFQPNDAIDVVRRGIESDDDVAAAVGQTFEDRKENLLIVVTGAVRLDARSKMPRRANRDARALVGVEERARDSREFVVRHDLDDRRRCLAWKRVTVPARPGCGAWPEQEGSQLGDRERIEVGVEAAITGAVETGRDGVVDENRPADLAKRDRA